MDKLIIHRFQGDAFQTLGDFTYIKDDVITLTGGTLELPWVDNKPFISCIKVGEYLINKHKAMSIRVMSVPGRYGILIHSGNTNKNTKGCMLVGHKHQDINKDGLVDIINSKITMKKLLDVIRLPCKLIITE